MEEKENSTPRNGKKKNYKPHNDYNGNHQQHHYHHGAHYQYHAYDEYRYRHHQHQHQHGAQHEQQHFHPQQQQQQQREQGTFVLLRSRAVPSSGLKTLKLSSNGSNVRHGPERRSSGEAAKKRKRGVAVPVQQAECCDSVPKPSWDTRRRDPRISGADVYVARVTRKGIIGPASPCWRCIEWCRWAGIKRIFHWDPENGRWEVVKVNDVDKVYCTNSDLKMVGGNMW